MPPPHWLYACSGPLIEKPIVPPLAWVAGLAIDGFGHHETPAIVPQNQIDSGVRVRSMTVPAVSALSR
jgi:hypothetical protein